MLMNFFNDLVNDKKKIVPFIKELLSVIIFILCILFIILFIIYGYKNKTLFCRSCGLKNKCKCSNGKCGCQLKSGGACVCN